MQTRCMHCISNKKVLKEFITSAELEINYCIRKKLLNVAIRLYALVIMTLHESFAAGMTSLGSPFATDCSARRC